MAHVIGPCSTLPGALHAVPEGTKCDDHPDRLAVKRVQGETDSFGAELNDMCDECYATMKSQLAEDRSGCCDWCKQHATDLRNKRDFEEGSCGPVYRVCGACVKRENDRLAEELDARDDHYDPAESCAADHDDDWGDDLDDIPDAPEMDDDEPADVRAVVDAQAGLPGRGARAYVDGKFIY